MKITTEKIENSQVVLSVEVDPSELEKSLDTSYRRLVRKVNVPGFRKGKAPRAILEQHIGKAAFLEDAVEELVPRVYNQAIEDQEINPIAQPQVEILQADPLMFKATVPVKPSVELGDYHQIRFADDPVEVSEEKVDSVIESLRSQHALWEPVERPLHYGDLAIIDIRGSLAEDQFLDEKGAQYRVVQGSSSPLPGFAEQLEGMKKGEEKEFSLSYPADYKVSELAGKECLFDVKIIEIKEEHLPELNDEFSKGLGEGFETLNALRERVTNNLKTSAEKETKRRFEQKVMDAVVGLSHVEFPPILVEREIDRFLDERVRYFGTGQRGLEGYLKAIGKTEEEARNGLRPPATKRVAQSLILDKVVEGEKIEASEEEINNEIGSMVKEAGEKASELQNLFNSPQARESVEELLLRQKALQRLVEIAASEAETNNREVTK